MNAKVAAVKAKMDEPSKMSHVWAIVFTLVAFAIVLYFVGSNVHGLREDVDHLKAVSATKAEVTKADSVLWAANGLLNKDVMELKDRMGAVETDVKVAKTNSDSSLKAVYALRTRLATVASNATTTSTALESLITRVATTQTKVETMENAPSLFTADQLKRLKTFADTPAAPPTSAPATK